MRFGFVKKHKKAVALLMCILMLLSVITTGGFSPRADGEQDFLACVNNLTVAPSNSSATWPVKMSDSFTFSMNFQLPLDSDTWTLVGNPVFSFKLDSIIAYDATNPSSEDIRNFINSASVVTSTPLPIEMNSEKVGYYTIDATGNVVLDFSIGAAALTSNGNSRTGTFNFSCSLNEECFEDAGGEYKIKYKTEKSEEDPTIYL
ncbi:MAG: hypothetical protein ACI4D8_00015, partial [Wujia sp.]